jgi:hypothetical protein
MKEEKAETIEKIIEIIDMEKNIKDKTPINTLPEYQIRTMKDDLAGLGLTKLKPKLEKIKRGAPPEKLPIVPEKAPLPGIEELVAKKEEATKPAKSKKPRKRKPVSKPKPKRAKKKPNLLVSLIIILIILAGFGLFFYWQGLKIPPLPPENQLQPKLKPSESLMPVEETKIISLSVDKSLFKALKQETGINQAIGTFKRITILKNEREFLHLIEFFEKLEIIIPPYVLTELKDNYNLILYNQNNKKRLGLIAETNNPQNLKEQIKFWEKTMVNDLKNFFLAEIIGKAASSEFQETIYPPNIEPDKQIAIRYIDFPEADLFLDYAIVKDIFILTISREAMYKIVDNLLKTID